MADPTISFADIIAPMFEPYRDNMSWRLDLTNYEDVKENASIIYDQIQSGQMPPPKAGRAYSKTEVGYFKSWMDQGYPQ